MVCTSIWSMNVGCCSPTRYNAHSTYEPTQGLLVHMPTWTVVLVTAP